MPSENRFLEGCSREGNRGSRWVIGQHAASDVAAALPWACHGTVNVRQLMAIAALSLRDLAAPLAGVTVDVVCGPKPGHGFTVQPRRWVVERTNGWINHCRRIDRHYETTLAAHEGFVYLSQIALPPRRLDHSQLFDTL